MSEQRTGDGGPAFPSTLHNKGITDVAGFLPGQLIPPFAEAEYRGLSVRDYFIAHAPHEPQEWFQPAMPEKPTRLYLDKKELTQDEATEYDYFHEYFPSVKPNELKTAVLQAYAPRALASYEAERAWIRDAAKQRFVQWPAAWADEQLKARAS